MKNYRHHKIWYKRCVFCHMHRNIIAYYNVKLVVFITTVFVCQKNGVFRRG